jgi:predicted Zn-dependent protease
MYRSQVEKIERNTYRSTAFLQPLIATLIAAFVYLSPAAFAQGGKDFGSSIIINVFSSDGQLLEVPAHVVLSSQGSSTATQQTFCDSGIATFNSVSPGQYSVTVDVAGYEEGNAQIETSALGTGEVSVIMEPTTGPSSSGAGEMGIVLAPKAQQVLSSGLSAIRAGKFDEAQRQLEAAYKLAPGDPDVNSALGELYIVKRDLPEAEHYIDRATSLGPDDVNSLLAAGELRILQRNPVGAEPALEHAVDVAPRDGFAHWLLGITYFNLGLYEKSKREAEQVIKINKGTATDGSFLLGRVLAALGRKTEALQTLDKFVHEVHDDYTPEAKTLIAKLQSQASDQSTAENTVASK